MTGLRVVGVLFALVAVMFAAAILAGPSTARPAFVFLAIQFGVMAAIFLLIARSMMRSVGHTMQLLRDGQPANATVSSIQDTGVTINNNPRVKLALHVVPQSGDPFDISATMLVPRLAVPRAGETYKIKYNPANPQDFAFVDEALSKPPALFTVRATLNDNAATVGNTTVLQGKLAGALFKAAGGSELRDKLNAALADPGVRGQLTHVHNADEAKQVLRSVLGDSIDTANLTFQTKTEVLSTGDSGAPSASDTPSVSATPPAEPSIVDQLTRLEELRDKGAVTTEEFDAIKQKLMSGA